MRFFVLSLLLTAGGIAHAVPATEPQPQPDAIDRLVAEKADSGLSGQLNQVRQSVADRSSELVVRAFGFLGVPYKRGGNSAESGGFDCSGFVRAMYDQTLGHVLPRRAEEQARATEVIDRKELQPGDLVFFNTMRRAFSHVGIYVGNGKFIHAPRTGSEIRMENLGGSYWQKRFNGARRVLIGEDEAPKDIH